MHGISHWRRTMDLVCMHAAHHENSDTKRLSRHALILHAICQKSNKVKEENVEVFREGGAATKKKQESDQL